MDKRKLGIGAILAVVALCALGAFLFRGAGNLLGGLGSGGNTAGSQPQLGALFVTDQLDSQGCPVGQVSQFGGSQVIYAGMERTQIPAGAEMFMRLYQNGQPVEDTPVIRADRAMNTCVWFEFRPSAGTTFDAGNYTAEMIINGNRAGQVAFTVGSGQGIANTGGAELGRLFTTTRVDQNGCPTDDVEEFYSDEPIYVSVEESYIPAGTELFARLNYEGQPVEDTDVIRAERDRQTCVWFVFEPVGGFNPGNYSVELFVNGSMVESLPVYVR